MCFLIRVRKFTKIFVLCIFLLSLSGCWNARELNALNVVIGMGLDSAENSNDIEVTAQVVNLSKSGSKKSKSEKGGGGMDIVNLTDSGPDIFPIIRGYTHEVNRKLYFPHNQIIVFGKDFASKGVRDSLDFFLRDHETRLTVNVLVAKGKAKSIFEAEPEYLSLPAADIEQILEMQNATSETATLRLFDFMSCLTSKTCSAVAPLIEVLEEGGKKHYKIAGGAVFKEDKAVGELDKTQTRGMLWVTGKIKSGLLRVNAKDQNATLEIISAKSKVEPKINEDGTIVFKIKIAEKSSLGSQEGSENFATPENLHLLEIAGEEKIQEEIQSAVDKAMELDADIFHFSQSVQSKYPRKWENIKKDWDQLFKTIQIEYDIDVKINKTGNIAKPNYPEEE
ncbi:MAG: Ger(x)C family spore germination protein [Clostridia bacterium]|nr:Ger(x)C family spore germination protein [Clostridia bacterium]